ncbi:hypothetical protein B0I37DRAFT_202850 [Chaetomium sp. MPI-CAGE-AT-0009]|nr:hypothetical protein B0I37DRAFT_202850 [Chaetomium sp. MPI-CAGE-AT-0009]
MALLIILRPVPNLLKAYQYLLALLEAMFQDLLTFLDSEPLRPILTMLNTIHQRLQTSLSTFYQNLLARLRLYFRVWTCIIFACDVLFSGTSTFTFTLHHNPGLLSEVICPIPIAGRHLPLCQPPPLEGIWSSKLISPQEEFVTAMRRLGQDYSLPKEFLQNHFAVRDLGIRVDAKVLQLGLDTEERYQDVQFDARRHLVEAWKIRQQRPLILREVHPRVVLRWRQAVPQYPEESATWEQTDVHVDGPLDAEPLEVFDQRRDMVRHIARNVAEDPLDVLPSRAMGCDAGKRIRHRQNAPHEPGCIARIIQPVFDPPLNETEFVSIGSMEGIDGAGETARKPGKGPGTFDRGFGVFSQEIQLFRDSSLCFSMLPLNASRQRPCSRSTRSRPWRLPSGDLRRSWGPV